MAESDQPAQWNPQAYGQHLLDEIQRVSRDVEQVDAINEQTSGTRAAIYTGLGILASGLCGNLLQTITNPALQPLTDYQSTSGLSNRYLRASLHSLAHNWLPAILGGAWMGVMTEGGNTPALPMEEIRTPLLAGLGASAVSTSVYTLLANTLTGSSIHTGGISSWSSLFQQSPTTVSLFNSTMALTVLTVWFFWERMDKQYNYERLQLRLEGLRRQLSAMPQDDETVPEDLLEENES
ncbi:hypothetical protein [Parendozoicomonas haliclonae]|uniref:Uncharacterized protein n=1 Tax=Parendozoicomonas haliclonae TaxID=1960125 RepID=A0A1X7AKM1_9GAMM|nr:hypothetical protein [Parendozoicomonas haliclonae]SMA47205.1 hypothetical protein EHSB41UT_02340 [Parendozoicomonas haliclonae]